MSRKEHVNPVMRRQRRKLRNQLIWGSAPVWLVVAVLAIKMITINVIESGAQEHMDRGEYAEAVAQYERLRTWNIFQPHLTYVNAGIAAMHGELWDRAVENLTSALRHARGDLYCEVQDMRYTALREYAWDLEDDGDAAVTNLRRLEAALAARASGQSYNSDDLDPDGDGIEDDPQLWLSEAIRLYEETLLLLDEAKLALEDPECDWDRPEELADTQQNWDEVQEKLNELREQDEQEQLSEEEQQRRDELNERNEQQQQEKERQDAEQQQQQHQQGQGGEGGQSGSEEEEPGGGGETGEGGESGEGEQPGEGGTDPGESGGSQGGEGNESGGEGGTDPGESGGSQGGEGNESGGEGGADPGQSGGEGGNQTGGGGGGGGPSQPTDPPDPNAGKDQNPITNRPW